MAVTDEFIRSFNARDLNAHFATFNFPHVRIANRRVQVFESREELERHPERYDTRGLEIGWLYSRWDARHVIHASPDKVHMAVEHTRYGPDELALSTHSGIYVITRIGGHWGIQARSSTAP